MPPKLSRARSPMRTPAPAARHICRANCSRPAPGSNSCRCPIAAAASLATAVLTRATDTSIGDFAAMIPLVREGRLRALAVTSKVRTPQAPDIPTMMEAGVPDYDVTTFFGVVAPAGTPDEIVRKLNDTLNEGLKTPEAQALIQRIGVVSHPGTSQEFAAFIASKRQLWGAAAKAIGANAN